MKKYYIAPDIFFEQIETNGIMDINTSGGTDVTTGVTGETYTDKPNVNEGEGTGEDLAKGTTFWDDMFGEGE